MVAKSTPPVMIISTNRWKYNGLVMALGKQAKVLSKKQIDQLLWYVGTLRRPLRNEVIVMLSVRAGLRAKEIASLTWAMVTDADGNISDRIHLTDKASKGRSGRIIPLNMKLRQKLEDLLDEAKQTRKFDIATAHVVTTERAAKTSAQTIVNMFASWYTDVGLLGCSSHSGRRTFITNAARNISTVGGSLRDVQMLAGHSSLAVTQRYIEGDKAARAKIVEII
ncbi:Tyrosine recombinase XerD [Aliiroseovarius sp. xm-g-7]|nr:Tyrosine recombinase XerD [Aliiroseovarius sp. xm-g-7]